MYIGNLTWYALLKVSVRVSCLVAIDHNKRIMLCCWDYCTGIAYAAGFPFDFNDLSNPVQVLDSTSATPVIINCTGAEQSNNLRDCVLSNENSFSDFTAIKCIGKCSSQA